MKKQSLLIIAACLILILMATGCANSEKKNSSDSVRQSSASTDTAAESSTEDAVVANQGVNQTQAVDLNDIDVDVTEKMYVTYINEIYVNTDDYLGKVIRIEGMFEALTDENTGNIYYYVYRTGPGCCGNDGAMCGFEFTWNGTMPKDNDWIEVIGPLRTYEEDGWDYLTLDAESVTVLEARGAETVYQ